MSAPIKPKSNQLNADDLIAGPRTITVTGVKLVAEDETVAISFHGDDGKPYKPCESMRRVLVDAWGSDGSRYVGRSMTLYLDKSVRFGGAAVGGIRIILGETWYEQIARLIEEVREKLEIAEHAAMHRDEQKAMLAMLNVSDVIGELCPENQQ